jgi:hypothetical protein
MEPADQRAVARRSQTVVDFGAGVLAAVVVTLAQSRIAWPGGIVAYDH